MRGNIADFSGTLRTLSFKTDKITDSERAELIAKINNLLSLILLQLNIFGLIEGNVAKILDEMPGLAERVDGKLLRDRDELLIAHSRWLLKAEWEKVKYEAGGFFIRLYLSHKAKAFLRRYRKFCAADGSLSLVKD